MTAHFKFPPIRSREYLDGAKGSPCRVNIPHVCTGDISTVVSAHIRDEHTGKAGKASDTSSVPACQACHDALDGRSITLSREDWLFYALRGIQRTIEDRVRDGTLGLKLDPEPAPMLDRPIKPRKPPSQRQKIAGASNWPPKGSQKLQSRNNLRRNDK